MQAFLIRLIGVSIAIYMVGNITPFLKVKDFGSAVGAAFFLGIANAIINQF